MKKPRRKILLLLTRFPDRGSKVLEALTGFYYTHASIGLEEDKNTFYSFVEKGFIVEKISRYVKPDREPYRCQLYEMEVPERVYEVLKDRLFSFVARKKEMHYTRLGLVLSFFRIPYKKRFHYFCSQFVAEVLQYAQAVQLKKNSAFYLPDDVRRLPGFRLRFQGDHQGLLQHWGLVPAK